MLGSSRLRLHVYFFVPAGYQLLPVWLQDVPVVLEPAHGDSQPGGAAGSLP
jgi:hypothetical protein